MPQPAQQYGPPGHATAKPKRVRIDADAACGTGHRRDPDNCLTLRSRASASRIDIAGISTVFGIVAEGESDLVMRALVWKINAGAGQPVSAALPVCESCGAAMPKCLRDGGGLDASAALREAAQRGTLSVVALGR